jgi:hypothetical protein
MDLNIPVRSKLEFRGMRHASIDSTLIHIKRSSWMATKTKTLDLLIIIYYTID